MLRDIVMSQFDESFLPLLSMARIVFRTSRNFWRIFFKSNNRLCNALLRLKLLAVKLALMRNNTLWVIETFSHSMEFCFLHGSGLDFFSKSFNALSNLA